MRVVVTGGAGFLGGRLADRLLAAGRLTGPSGGLEAIDEVVLVDVAHPHPHPAADADDQRVMRISGDIADRDLMASVLDRDDVSVFHLAAMVSAECELEFDRAWRVNLDGTRSVFEAARARSGPRVVFASSIAAFGGPAVAGRVGDETKLTPETTYGTLKAIGELLVNDYSRKGFFDGRSARIPTVVIRPGRPNAAASSWVSGIFREPVNGQSSVVPVDPDTPVPVSGYRTVVENLCRLHEVDARLLGSDRAVNLPAIAATARQMTESLRTVVTDRELGPVTHQLDPAIASIFAGWPQGTAFDRATELGLVGDESIESIIQAYLSDYATVG